MEEKNIILKLATDFAVRIIGLSKVLIAQKAYSLADQILRNGTSIGANISESEFRQSMDDFISKMSIALKEANETKYWLLLLHKSDYINKVEYESMNNDCMKIIGTLVKIINTSKAKRQEP